jgi:hypothetical protein
MCLRVTSNNFYTCSALALHLLLRFVLLNNVQLDGAGFQVLKYKFWLLPCQINSSFYLIVFNRVRSKSTRSKLPENMFPANLLSILTIMGINVALSLCVSSTGAKINYQLITLLLTGVVYFCVHLMPSLSTAYRCDV